MDLDEESFHDLAKRITSEDLLGLARLAVMGAMTDGAHHKQWCLVRIAQLLGAEWEEDDIEEGIAP